jgi:tetratricopeptide (TPR) repeat protein
MLGVEKALGPEHPTLLLMVSNLGTLYHEQGKLDEAEQMYLKALKPGTGLEVPNIRPLREIDTMYNLGLLYSKKGELGQAEEMYQLILQSRKEVFGPWHKSTLKVIENIGILYCQQDELDEAEKMLNLALYGFEKVMGPEDGTTLPRSIA